MTARAELIIPLYYDEKKSEWLINNEEHEDLVKSFFMIVDAMNRKYRAVRDGCHSYVFGWLDKDLANKIEARYPGLFEPDGDFFDTAIDEDTLSSVWSLEDFYNNVVKINYQDDVDGDTFEDFKKSIGVEE